MIQTSRVGRTGELPVVVKHSRTTKKGTKSWSVSWHYEPAKNRGGCTISQKFKPHEHARQTARNLRRVQRSASA
jgi:hypothetical protein